MVTGADPRAQAFSGRISLGLRRPSRDLIHHPHHSIPEYPYIQILNFHLSILHVTILSNQEIKNPHIRGNADSLGKNKTH